MWRNVWTKTGGFLPRSVSGLRCVKEVVRRIAAGSIVPRYAALTVVLAFLPAAGAAQVLDPDWCWTCRDSRDHALAGVGLDVGARLVWPRWSLPARLAFVAGVGLVYEVGQESIVRTSGLRGPGYGLGPKDFACDMLGAVAAELAIYLARRIF